MFWNTNEPHGLPHDPFKSCVIPRPIGWISSVAADGTLNLAPYSFFNGVSADPPMVMFSSGSRPGGASKDSIANAQATGEFVCNMVSWELRHRMNETSAGVPPETNEFELAGLEMEPSTLVSVPRVKAAPIHMECKTLQVVTLPAARDGGANALCIGRVIGIHFNDEVLIDGLIDVEKIRPVARLGYMDYTSVESVFSIQRPKT